LQLEQGASAVDPAATGAVLQALKKVCMRGSLGPFALEAGADVGEVDPAATGAALQAFFGARAEVPLGELKVNFAGHFFAFTLFRRTLFSQMICYFCWDGHIKDATSPTGGCVNYATPTLRLVG
jgi:hypothetical protein